MGLAALYNIRDDFEDSLELPSCPGPADPDCFEIPIVMQDRKFNPDGTLYYPDLWQDHFFGDKMLVNGKVWPYQNVKQGKYRLRLLNGCNSRTLTLTLDRLDQPGTANMPFVQIGTDGGLMELPVTLDEITLASAERADTIVDFTDLPAGTEVVLTNSAPAPWPGNPGVGVIPNVMKFIVQDSPGYTDPIPSTLLPFEEIDELEAVRTRDFVLNKETDACGSIWKMNGLGWNDITEYPQLGTTEIWRFINDGNSVHPMHMHLVFFQVLDRQPIGGGGSTPPEPNEIGWKDTAKALPNQMTRLIARFTDYPGRFAYHCHLLEHEDHEMMRQFWTVDAVDISMAGGGRITWLAQPGAVTYDVVRGDLIQLRASGGNFALGSVTLNCLDNDVVGLDTLDDSPVPAGGGFWYLIRSTDAIGDGTYDSGSSSQVDMRDDEILSSGNGCP
jgi:spore coat protein A